MAALVTYVDTAKQHEQSSTPVEPPASNRTVELNWEGQEKICSSLPMEEAEFKEIVVDFVAELHGRLEGMQGLLANEDYTSLAVEAHWLKGAGGTCGFDCFFEPARRLELAARAPAATGSGFAIAGDTPVRPADRIAPTIGTDGKIITNCT